MAKPPSSAHVLFDVQSESSTIKQGKDGSYKLVMEDIETVHWETDSAKAEDGYYSAKKYAKKFDTYYGKDAEVSAYETFFLADGSKEKCKFTVTDVKYNQKSNKLVYDITPKNKKQAEKITGIEGEAQTESAVYSTERTRCRRRGLRAPCNPPLRPDWMPNGQDRDLRGANLSRMNLRHARLDRADLTDARMVRTDLRWARLTDANLRDASLVNANLGAAYLGNADLSGADLLRVNLTGFASLRGADLTGARLTRAVLGGADLSDARLDRTELKHVDLRHVDLRGASLSGARGLDKAIQADMARWFETTCPDGSMNVGTQPCSGDQLIPLA